MRKDYAASARTWRRRGLLCAAAGVALAWAASAHAQAIERNLPPARTPPASEIAPPNVLPDNQDAAPIGPVLKAIIVLGPKDAVVTGFTLGLDLSRAPRLDTPAGRSLLSPFVGQPLSKRLIGQIEAAVARYYRERRFPFVSFSTPPQELTGGVLQVRVVEFTAGKIDVTGSAGTPTRYIEDRIRLQPGQPIDTAQLSQDLDWLNRYPYRQVEAVFQPGDDFGRTDLDLRATSQRPFQADVGYANSGSPSTGWDRYFLGVTTALPFLQDATASYQFTASANFFADQAGRVFGDSAHPSYISHGLRLFVPTAPRQAIELTFDAVQTNVASDPFSIRQETYELALSYHSALSNFVRLPGDATFGLEAKRETRETLFDGIDALDRAINVYQLYGGWADAWSDGLENTSFSATVHGSPGGLGAGNHASAFAVFTANRVTDAAYGYVNAQISRAFRLPARWTWTISGLGQYSGAPLPDTEQLGVGGQSLVRGYTLDDGAFDTAIVVRNEVRTPQLPVLQRFRLADSLSPYVFADAGEGRSYVARTHVTAISTAVGADYQLGQALSASVSLAHDFDDATATRDGHWLLQSRVVVTF
ncbi:MAG: ShlB/FhaC/HecB family hemolysin secretion/activation protein [Caulobacteraceae bacterium]